MPGPLNQSLGDVDNFEHFVTVVVQNWVLDVSQFECENDTGEPWNTSFTNARIDHVPPLHECRLGVPGAAKVTDQIILGFCGVDLMNLSLVSDPYTCIYLQCVYLLTSTIAITRAALVSLQLYQIRPLESFY